MQRGELDQPLRREQAGEPLVSEALGRAVQQGGRRRVEIAEHDIHHLPGAVGDDLRQQKGDAAVLEGFCELVQMLGHGGTSPWNDDTIIDKTPASCNRNAKTSKK